MRRVLPALSLITLKSQSGNLLSNSILCSSQSRKIDILEPALLPDERTDLVSTNRLGHGWARQWLANQQPSPELAGQSAAISRGKNGCGLDCDWLPAQEPHQPHSVTDSNKICNVTATKFAKIQQNMQCHSPSPTPRLSQIPSKVQKKLLRMPHIENFLLADNYLAR